MGTRACFRRSCILLQWKVRSRLLGRALAQESLYCTSISRHSLTLKCASKESENQADDGNCNENVRPEVGQPLQYRLFSQWSNELHGTLCRTAIAAGPG